MELVLSGNHFGDTDWALINIVKPFEKILGTTALERNQWWVNGVLVSCAGVGLWWPSPVIVALSIAAGVGFVIILDPAVLIDALDHPERHPGQDDK